MTRPGAGNLLLTTSHFDWTFPRSGSRTREPGVTGLSCSRRWPGWRRGCGFSNTAPLAPPMCRSGECRTAAGSGQTTRSSLLPAQARVSPPVLQSTMSWPSPSDELPLSRTPANDAGQQAASAGWSNTRPLATGACHPRRRTLVRQPTDPIVDPRDGVPRQGRGVSAHVWGWRSPRARLTSARPANERANINASAGEGRCRVQ
jgi:hypothetical protein